MSHKSQLELYLEELDNLNAANKTDVYENERQLCQNCLDLNRRHDNTSSYKMLSLQCLPEVLLDVINIVGGSIALMVFALLPSEYRTSAFPTSFATIIFKKFGSYRKKSQVVAFLFFFCLLLQINQSWILMATIQRFFKYIFCIIFILSFLSIVSSTCLGWKLRDTLTRVNISLRYIRKLQSLTLGKGISAATPSIFSTKDSVLHNNSFFSSKAPYWSAFMSSRNMKTRLQIALYQLHSQLYSSSITADQADQSSFGVAELLQQTDKMLHESEFLLSQSFCQDNEESVIMLLSRSMSISLPLLATLSHITSITDAIVSVKLPSIHTTPSVRQSDSPVIDTLVLQQCHVLSHIRSVRQEAEILLTKLLQAECLLQESIGDYNFLSDTDYRSNMLKELHQIFDSSIGVQPKTPSSSPEDMDMQDAHTTSIKLWSNVMELRDAWLALEPTWSCLLQQQYSWKDFHEKNTSCIRSYNKLPLDKEDLLERLNDNMPSEQCHLRQDKLSTEFSSATAEEDDLVSHDKITQPQMDKSQVMEVFVATIGKGINTKNKEVLQEDANLLSLRKQQQHRKTATKSLIHELQQSLLQRDHSEPNDSEDSFKFFQEKKPLQRIRDFDSYSVREERVEIPLLTEMMTLTTKNEDNSSTDNEETRKKDMESIQQSAQFASEKHLVRNELKNILGAMSASHQYCLGDDDSSDENND